MKEELYMRRCIDLALMGGKHTMSNPNVGCVIVHDDVIIGEGYHHRFGESHAEVNAINDVSNDHLHLLPNATMYVSLEPCCIQGKTPPCSSAIIKSGIKNLIIGILDPNPEVNGQGVAELIRHGLEIKTGFLEKECSNLLKKFKANLGKRPYIILKWAQTYDGYIGHKNERLYISNEYAQVYNHKWRTEVDAIIVGKNTAIADNPELTVRHYEGDNPIRVAVDSQLEVPTSHHLLSDGERTIIINKIKSERVGQIEFVKMDEMKPKNIVEELFNHNIYSLIVEGGEKLLQSFIDAELWDEARIIKSNKNISGEYDASLLVKAPLLKGKELEKYECDDNEIFIVERV